MAEPSAENADSAIDELKRRARWRLIGAVVLALAAATLLPLLLEQEQKPLGDDVSVQIPPVDGGKFVTRIAPDKSPAPSPEPRPDAPPAAAPVTPPVAAPVTPPVAAPVAPPVPAPVIAAPVITAPPPAPTLIAPPKKPVGGAEGAAKQVAKAEPAPVKKPEPPAVAAPKVPAAPAAKGEPQPARKVEPAATTQAPKTANAPAAKSGSSSAGKAEAAPAIRSEPVAPKIDPAVTPTSGVVPDPVPAAKTDSAPTAAKTDSAAQPAAKADSAPAPAARTDSARPPAAKSDNGHAGTIPKGDYAIQLGAFTDSHGASTLVAKLKKAGYAAYTETTEYSRGTLYRVRVGGYATKQAANQARTKLKADGHDGRVVATK